MRRSPDCLVRPMNAGCGETSGDPEERRAWPQLPQPPIAICLVPPRTVTRNGSAPQALVIPQWRATPDSFSRCSPG